ncbi:transcription factor domain-containing protein [Aspergillus chevalieri]|uniref:Zn(2)-C6 fungal-type domain-containing protein n=1 Tax=Aspergillus chevalieri TaxID=182096 RepID=A0A7R7VWP8_ASPCH|nr:uncharacterized protein ACHE_80089A [Aspergillus chevalieri]BCR92189.1 hypothetical protein ACHE_80089A [Aspergillus chevalieri]
MTLTANAGVKKSFRARACENCRLRKIRCDKESPCSSCSTLGIACSAIGSPSASQSQPGPQPRAALNQYEHKIDLIQEQLLSLQRTVQDLARPPVPAPTPNPPSYQVSSTPAFEGQSSFNSETRLARDAAYSAVAGLQSDRPSEDVSAALASLKHSLDKHNPAQPQAAKKVTESSEDQLLPVAFVVAVVKKIKAQPPFCLVSHAWRDYLQIESLCQSIYFPADPIPAGSLTLLHGLLYFVVRDYLHEDDPDLAKFDASTYCKFCEDWFSAGLKSYEMMIDPTLEKIQALLLGVIKAQEESNIQLCWTYLALAFNMCQTMGLHRRSTLQHESLALAETKRHVFWSLYTVDKHISLNLGVTSHFQDHDIDADLFTPSDKEQQRPWDLMTFVIVEFSRLQGQVYDRLYSTSASNASATERSDTIERLSSDLMAVRDKLLAIDVRQGLYSDSLHGMAACADFITYSILTIIHRAQTRPSNAMAISTECFDAATLALQSHLKCFAYFRDRKIHKQAEYVNWILLYPSFTPFVIVFTHAITTASPDSLSLLHETVSSLNLIKRLSRASLHLYEICTAFVKTAQALLDSRQTLTGLEQHHDGLLLASADADTGDRQGLSISLPDVTGTMEGGMDGGWMSSAGIEMFLNDFIGSNRSAMGILGEGYLG